MNVHLIIVFQHQPRVFKNDCCFPLLFRFCSPLLPRLTLVYICATIPSHWNAVYLYDHPLNIEMLFICTIIGRTLDSLVPLEDLMPEGPEGNLSDIEDIGHDDDAPSPPCHSDEEFLDGNTYDRPTRISVDGFEWVGGKGGHVISPFGSFSHSWTIIFHSAIWPHIVWYVNWPTNTLISGFTISTRKSVRWSHTWNNIWYNMK